MLSAYPDGRCLWYRGKVIGGSSVLNFMFYVRCDARDYDEWEQNGNPGWGYSDVLEYFKKSENMIIPDLIDSPYHGTGGFHLNHKWLIDL